MPAFQWNDRFRINVDQIDNQHNKLFEIINHVQDTIHSEESDQVIGKALIDLAEYSNRHFASEEALMRKIDFAEFLRHRTMHAGFSKWLADTLTNIKQGRTVNIHEFIAFLKRWWEDHILREDKKIGKAVEDLLEKADRPAR
jgi:hemerythrin